MHKSGSENRPLTPAKGEDAPYSIGRGYSSGSSCGTVTIGGDATTYDDGVAESPFVYPTTQYVALSAVTSADYLGWRICSDGNAYAAAGPLPTGVTAVAKIVYVGSKNSEAAPYNHGLAIALSDANGGTVCAWSTSKTKVHTYNTESSSFASESGLQYNATHNSDTYPAFQAAIANNGTAAPTGCSSWFLASGYQWLEMINATGLSNLGLQESAVYWLSTEYNADSAWDIHSYSGYWGNYDKGKDHLVRSCLAF